MFNVLVQSSKYFIHCAVHTILTFISFSPCCHRNASVFLQRGPQRIGSVYKKAVYKQYSDATYETEVAKAEWLGYLGPLLMAEQGDTVVIHLRNAASRPYSIHPHGLNYSKSSEGNVAYGQILWSLLIITTSDWSMVVLLLKKVNIYSIKSTKAVKNCEKAPLTNVLYVIFEKE